MKQICLYKAALLFVPLFFLVFILFFHTEPKGKIPENALWVFSSSTLQNSKRNGEIMISLSQPLIIAHRGASKLAPENTLPAFKKALQLKPDFVELDYHTTKDGKMVVIHDDYLDRTTDANIVWRNHTNIAIAEKTLKEIKTLDAGSWFHWGKSEFNGTPIPTLKEALDVIRNSSLTLIERKRGNPKDLFHLLKREGLLTRVIVQSFDWDFIEKLGEYGNAIDRGTLGPPWGTYKGRVLTEKEKWLNKEFIEDIAFHGARFIGWNNWVTAESVALAHEKELRVLIYTIDDPDEAERLVKLGVDGIITNDVESIAKRLRK